jgi:hypothetical protein
MTLDSLCPLSLVIAQCAYLRELEGAAHDPVIMENDLCSALLEDLSDDPDRSSRKPDKSR